MRYDAVAFLEGLFQPRTEFNAENAPSVPYPRITPDNLPADWHFRWDERAAIMEYDGKLPREHAEALALTEVLQLMQQAGGTPDWSAPSGFRT
jgi:hypothetical protein